MKAKIVEILMGLVFTVLTFSPQSVFAESLDVKECLEKIQTHWAAVSENFLVGQTRTENACQLQMNISKNSFDVNATGDSEVSFSLNQNSVPETETLLQRCKVEKEKLHVVFEQTAGSGFEKRERVQMTLLKREGKGLSLILSKRENKVLQPLLQNNLICHLKID